MSSPFRNGPSNSSPVAPPKSGLTVSKIVAGAGAAATTAVVGSVFGADGTVIGAAVGSIVSAVAAAAYERSLDRTRRVVVARVRPPGGRTAEITQVIATDVTQVIPAQRPASAARAGGPVAPVPPPRRTRLPLYAFATAMIFFVGLLGVTGVELLAGGPVLSSQRGTSVGTVLGDDPDPGSSTTGTSTATAPASPTTSSTTTPSSSSKRADRPAPEATLSGSPAADAPTAPAATSAPSRRNTADPQAPRA